MSKHQNTKIIPYDKDLVSPINSILQC